MPTSDTTARGRQPSPAAGAAAGLIATATMDLGAQLAARLLHAQPLHPALLGRWVGHLLRGRIRHHDITTATGVKGEAVLGAVTHYAIGAVLGTGYTLILGRSTSRPPSLPFGIAYGASTTAFAWFALFPSMGFGVMAQTARQRRLLELSLLNHGTFGLALGLSIRRFGRNATGPPR